MRVEHDSQSLLFREPAGAVPCQTEITFRLRVDAEIRSATLRLFSDKEYWIPMEKETASWFRIQIRMPKNPMLCWYDFRAEDLDGNIIACGCPQDGLGGKSVVSEKVCAWQITVYDPGYDTPHWLREGIMYQIFPDRFAFSGEKHPHREECVYHKSWQEDPILMPEGGDDNCARDFFCGDLNGIREHLAYLKELGVTVLYLNPVFQARSNHRYDTADYTRIDPLLGTNEDFSLLCIKAKECGIRIILDGVFSHTGEDSVYFNRYGRFPSVGACQSHHSPYYFWYKFFRYPDTYKTWWGFHSLPEINKMDESYRRFMFSPEGIVRRWIQAGSFGWRLDVADELPMPFLRELRKAVKTQNRDAVVLGEVWEDASHKVAYDEMRCYCQGDTLDSVMYYPLREAALSFFTGKSDAEALRRLILSQLENYPLPFYYSLMNLAGSHDRARAINVLSGYTWEDFPVSERGKKRLTKDAYQQGVARYVEMMKLLCALPGIPCVYYGDEQGMEGGPDPFCRGTFPWQSGDKHVEEEIKTLLWKRRSCPALQTGSLRVETPDKDTLIIIREIKDGHDVFGAAAVNERVEIKISRASK